MSKKPKVLRIINRFNLGGPTYNVAYLTKFMEDDFDTLLVGGQKDLTEDTSEFILDTLGIKPVIIPEMQREINFSKDRKAYRKIAEIIQNFKPDVVHTHASKAGALGRLAAFNNNVPVVLHTFHGHVFHSYFNPVKTWIFKNIERYLARKSTKIIAISELQKKELSQVHKIASEDKFEVIPLGFDLSRFKENYGEKRKSFREQYQIQENEVAIGIVGRLVPVKNHTMFINAIEKLANTTEQPFKAFIIGGGELEERLKKIVQEKSLSEKIIFTSWIRNIDWAYAGLDIVCLTSLNEGTPVSLIEAQAAGKPIVTTRVGGIENIVMENRSALLCDVSDEALFYAHLKELTENKQKRERLSGQAQAHVFEKFTYRRLVLDMKELYFKLLSSSL
ncbi:MAG: glycosyltransferase family 1 protein [Bacteroidetes bacterium]|nr:MAG: glycosyltransferase family 1 protein [Bacteroidota bacterium]